MIIENITTVYELKLKDLKEFLLMSFAFEDVHSWMFWLTEGYATVYEKGFLLFSHQNVAIGTFKATEKVLEIQEFLKKEFKDYSEIRITL